MSFLWSQWFLPEFLKSLISQLFLSFFHILEINRIFQHFLNRILKKSGSLLNSLNPLTSAHIKPCTLNSRSFSTVNILHIPLAKTDQCRPIQSFIIDFFRSNQRQYFVSDWCDLIDKFRSQHGVVKFIQPLQIFLLLCGSKHQLAIPIPEKFLQMPSHLVFTLYCIRWTLLLLQSILQVLLRINRVPIFVPQHQCEIPYHPKESRKGTQIIANFSMSIFDFFSQIEYQIEGS